MMRHKVFGSSLAALVAAMYPAYGSAQANQRSDTDAAQSGATPGSDAAQNPAADIIVTANKRAQSLQDTPVAVTAVSQERLKSLNLQSVADLGAVTPSLNYIQSPSPQSTQFTIRGVGTFAFNDTLEASVGVVLDGVPQARLIGSLSDTVDVQQIQLLRGPQGTIFGKNATAGVIDIAFTEAQLDETSVRARGFLGSYDERRIEGTVNVPLVSDRVALRVTGWSFRRDGYIDAPLQPSGAIGGFNNRGGRIKAAIRLSDAWRIDLSAEASRNTNDGSIVTTRSYLPTDTIQPNDIRNGVIAGPDNRRSAKDFPESGVITQQRLVAKSVTDLGPVTLTAVGGYGHTHSSNLFDFDYTDSTTIAQPSISHYQTTFDQWTGEVRLANSSPGRFQYTIGAFYYHLKVLSDQQGQNLRFVAPFTSFGQIIRETTRNYAGFADASYDIGALRLLAGGRVSNERSVGRYDRGASTEFPKPAILNGPLSVANTVRYRDFSWRFGAQLRPVEEIMFYATASRAYKGPGFNYTFTLTPAQFALNGGVVEAEVARSYEVGVRSQFFGKQLTLNLTGFHSPYSNFQVTALLPTVPATYTTINANELTAQGIELEFALKPHALPGFSLDGNIVYNDTHYSDFKNAPCYSGQPSSAVPTSQPNICAPIATGSTVLQQNVSGDRTVGAPAWQANVITAYEHSIGDRFRAFGQVRYNYTGRTQFAVGTNPVTSEKAYDLVDLTLGFGSEDRRWTVRGYVKNLFDKSFVSRIALANPGVVQTIPFAAMRTGGVSLDLSF